MKTEDLIQALAADLQPISPFALQKRLLIAAAISAAGTLAIVAVGYGWREDLAVALATWPFCRKLTFTLAVALLALWTAFRAGLAAGGIAATMYGLHCPEWAASFVATWYSLGILASGVLGAVIGRRVLRW